MKLFRILVTILAASISSSALAGTSAGWGHGGAIAPYEAMIAQANASGELFRIQGVCKSVCTMFLSISNVCVEPSAQLMFHAGVSPAIVARLNAATNAVVADPEVAALLLKQGVETRSGTPEMLAARIKGDLAKWRDLVVKAGIKAQ